MVATVQVVFDCARPQQQAEFWAAALGYVVQPPPPGYDSWPDLLREMGVPEDQWDSRSAVVDPDGGRPRIFFQRVPEAKAVKNRVHLDIQVGPGIAAAERPAMVRDEVTRLTGLGARQDRVMDEMGEHWVVMIDPEGNEFCVS
ncbi:MAG: VOC family protein [Actinomycetes bacterium]